jgi:tRNA threonylcarbamoyladenosine biosynthesis protein TsaE
MIKYDISTQEQTTALAYKIASDLKLGSVLALKGDLGVGKTFFTKHLISKLRGEETSVISPTFQLLQIYNASNYNIYHYDLYRLKHPDELYELGLEEAICSTNICIIEWPELIFSRLPKETIVIDMILENNGSRFATI